MSPLRKHLTRTYVPLVIGVGVVVLAVTLPVVGLQAPPNSELAACIALITGVLLGELFPVRLGGAAGEVAYSSTFTFALLLGWGPGLALVAQLGACLVAGVVHRSEPRRLAFNLAQYVLAIGAAILVLEIVRGHQEMRSFAALDLLEVTLASAAFFLVNTGVVAGVVALHAGSGLREQVAEDLRLQTGTEGILLGMAPLALLGVLQSPALLLLIALPLLAVQRAGTQAADNERLALQDALTGLANRVAFTDRSRQALARARRDEASVAVLLVDLDRFKDVNDTLGHHAGDRVLRAVAERIVAEVREEDTVARLGGDEFAVLLTEVESPAVALEIARRVASALAQPLEIAPDVTLEPGGSVGIACSPDHGDDVDTLLRHADAAMYAAKEDRSGVALYALIDEGDKLTQLKLAGRLGSAIADGEIELRFQPQVVPQTGEVIGVEALAHWRHPQLGMLPPGRFVPLAERSGHIQALTVRVIEDALAQLAGWQRQGLDLTMAINLSARSLADPALPRIVERACLTAGVDPHRVVLEITEGMLLAQPDQAIAVAEELAALGAAISVDDFGTGFSSLEQLVRLPAAELKVDRSFVAGLGTDPRSTAIVQCVADLAHSMGLRLVAEGVETEAVREAIVDLGCDLAQGFLWARSLTADAVVAHVLDRQAGQLRVA